MANKKKMDNLLNELIKEIKKIRVGDLKETRTGKELYISLWLDNVRAQVFFRKSAIEK